MSRISKQTMEFSAERFFEIAHPLHTAPSWDQLSEAEKFEWRRVTVGLVEVFRLPVEVDLRNRLLSQAGLAAAARQIDEELPDGFEWRNDDTETRSVFAAAVLAALSDTEPS